jgi:hypothetical protein
MAAGLIALSDRACRTAGFEGIGRLSGHVGRDSPAGGFHDRLRENLRPRLADIGDGHGPDGVMTFCDTASLFRIPTATTPPVVGVPAIIGSEPRPLIPCRS